MPALPNNRVIREMLNTADVTTRWGTDDTLHTPCDTAVVGGFEIDSPTIAVLLK